jgi:hypothetical protein
MTGLLRTITSRCERVVGWGTGSVFDYFHHRHPRPLAYLVDNDRTRWGDRRAGLTIVGPSRLADEDPETTLVIVYSGAWPEIVNQIKGMGFVHVVAASTYFALAENEALRETLKRADALAASPIVREPRGDRAVMVQGPLDADFSPLALRLTAVQHPHDRIILSTWQGTSGELLDAVAPFIDDLVLSQTPEPRGVQNRNCQIVSARAGLEYAKALGARQILKSRTDLVPLADGVFDRAEALRLEFPANGCMRTARERLIIPSSFTRKYLLYHPADLVMLGDVDDLITYFSAPLDPRSGDLSREPLQSMPLSELAAALHPAETYLARNYMLRLGWPATGDVRDSWAFYRDMFMVVDNDWFDLLWLKNPAIPDVGRRHGVRQCVTHAFWRALATGEVPLPELTPADYNLRTFGAAA